MIDFLTLLRSRRLAAVSCAAPAFCSYLLLLLPPRAFRPPRHPPLARCCLLVALACSFCCLLLPLAVLGERHNRLRRHSSIGMAGPARSEELHPHLAKAA